MTLSAEAAVLAYVKSWLTNDPAERQALLEQCWSDAGVYLDPMNRAEGRAGLSALIDAFHTRLPGATFKFASGVDEHHGSLRFQWVMLDADGQTRAEGFDIGERDKSGRLQRITGFFGPFPPPPASWNPQLRA
jgi:hypothetical protein